MATEKIFQRIIIIIIIIIIAFKISFLKVLVICYV